MEKLICLLLCALLVLVTGCGNTQESVATTTEAVTEPTVDRTTPLSDGKTLKILAITSSFGLNTTELLHEIAIAEGGEEVIVGRLYASGCTLQQHVENLANNAPSYEYTKKVSGGWKKTEGATMLYGLQDEQWDVIFVQQSAARAGQADSYKDYVDTLMTFIQANKTNPKARCVWNMTWAYDQNTDQAVFAEYGSDQMQMYQAILETTQQIIVPRKDFYAIIPSGTAIQNARTYYGDTLTKDTFHLNDFGRIIAGYTLYSVLVDRELTEIKLDEAKSYEFLEPVKLTEQDKLVILEAVNNAIRNPFEVTPSSYTKE